MAQSGTAARTIPSSRFAWLMALYAENFRRIQQVVDLAALDEGRWCSRGADGLDLHVDVLARHRYMLELRMSYAFADPATGLPEPSAYVRVYLDACQAEVTHCYVGQRWQDVLGTHPPAHAVFAHRLRMNTFLSKWLEHLRGAGHGGDWLPAEAAA
ncbi:MAG: hypothetical protein COW59_05900, partial [Lysobacterales bacterium CG17_big_fil_post_rev_8_21_14_2_50_64_11]